MPVHCRNVEIQRPDSLGSGNWNLKNLTEVTVLFGKNGSGKSVLLRAWRDAQSNISHYVAPERTGEMDFEPYLVQQELDASRREEVSSRNFMSDYRRRAVSRIQPYFLKRGNFRGNNVAPNDPAEIEQFIEILFPDFTIEILPDKIPPFILLRTDNLEAISGVNQLSSGEAQLVTLALDILTKSAIWELDKVEKRIMLIDEPDAHIHPDMQSRFADFLFQLTNRFKLQILVATHSPSLLAALGQFGGQRTSVIYLQRNQSDYCAKSFSEVQHVLLSCLGGAALIGPLFEAPLLIVEGDDDYRIWSQVPRHHITNFTVIPGNGDQIRHYQRSLETIFSSLRDPGFRPAGYVLLDGDKSLPKPNPKSPQNHIRYIRLACHESENLYLTDEVLALLGINWEEAVELIVGSAAKFGDKAEFLSKAGDWDRRNEDIKDYIDDIARILDDKNVLWTVRIGRALGRSVPTGQLREFLGEEVVNALWPNNQG